MYSIFSKMNRLLIKKDLYVLFLFFLLPLVFFFRIFFSNGDHSLYLGSDFISYFTAFHYYVEQLRALSFPFWDPYMYQGVPFFARMDLALLYPINFFFAFIGAIFQLDLGSLYTWYEYYPILHISLGGIFMYWLCMDLKISRYSSLIAGMLFMLSGTSLMMINTVPLITTAIWLPLLLLLLRRGLYASLENRTHSFLYFLYFLLVLSISHFAGYIQNSLFYSGSFLFIYCIYWSVENFNHINKKIIVKNFLLFFSVFISSLLLYSVQFIPSFQLAQASNRDHIDFNTALYSGAMEPLNIIDLAVQNSFRFIENGSPVSVSGGAYLYFGILPLFLFIMSFCYYRDSNRQKMFFVATFFIFLLASLGGFFSLYEYTTLVIPWLDKFRNVFKTLYIASLSFSALVGFGLDYLLDKKEDDEHARYVERIGKYVFLFGVFSFVIYFFSIQFNKNINVQFLQQVTTSALNAFVIFAILFFIAFFCAKYAQNRFVKFVIIFFLFFDLLNFNRYILANNFRYNPDNFLSVNGKSFLDIIKKDNDIFRVILLNDIYGAHYAPEVLKIHNVRGYSSFVIKEIANNLTAMEKFDITSNEYAQKLSDFGVKYIVSGSAIQNANFTLVDEVKIDMHSYKDYFYYAGNDVGVVNKSVGSKNYLYSNNLFNGFVSGDAAYRLQYAGDERLRIVIDRSDGGEVEVKIPDYPGWNVFKNGSIIDHWTSENGYIVFKVGQVENGEESLNIELQFRQRNLIIYTMISIFSLIITLILIIRMKSIIRKNIVIN